MEANDSNRLLVGFGSSGGDPSGGHPEGSCLHCGLPIPDRRKSGLDVESTWFAARETSPLHTSANSSNSFCCSGCAVAYQAIRLAGLDRTYYSLRHLSAEAVGVPARPSATSVLSKQQIASDRFVRESTKELKNGNRQACLAIDGLTCAACGWLAEQVVTGQAGMRGAAVNLPDATITFEFDPESASLEALLNTLAQFGYELHPRKNRPDGPSPQERKLLTKVGISWALAGNIMLLAFAMYAGLTLESDHVLANGARWLSLLIGTGAVTYGGSVFFRTAAASIKIAIRNRSLRRIHIDTPISLGILGGYGNSAWATITGRGDIWFDSIAVLIAALLTARWLQTRSQRTAAQAATRLLDMIPSVARRIHADGVEEYVASDEIDCGETIRVDPDEIIPVDGSIVSGRSSINTAVITGESAPVSVEPGDAVFAGSINQSTPLLIMAESSGRNTRVGMLLDWLEDSTNVQAPVVQTADRLSALFVIAILVAAVGTAVAGLFLFPESIVQRVVALLVISCPCALGMATPLAIAAANGKAARRGIYIKDGSTVESLARVSTVVFDKTGTLTEGNLSLVLFDGSDESLLLVAGLEQHSRHPVARSISAAATERLGLDIEIPRAEDVESVPGFGIRGSVSGHRVVVGRPDWVANQVLGDTRLKHSVTDAEESVLTPISIAVDEDIVALATFGDRIRPQSRYEVQQLKNRGIKVLLLSGDHPDVVRSVAKVVGIAAADAYGAVGPEGKQQIIDGLRRNETVMMIGDGANDAAALRSADVGVAVGNDNTPCLVASDIFVPTASGASVEPLLTFGNRVLRLIRRNLALSLAYNVVAGGAAILGFVTPLEAAIAMPLSSLFVVSTSAAIRPFESDGRDKSSAIGRHTSTDSLRIDANMTPVLSPVKQ